jgi:hypothetical protein
MKHIGKMSLAAAALLFSGAAHAATFTETLNLPDYRNGIPRVLQASGPFETGLVLSAADEISNPDGWGNAFNVFIDTDAQTVTLVGDGSNTYQTIDVDITGITEFVITGLFAVDPYGATDNQGFDYSYSAGFSANSLHFSYSVDSLGGGDYFGINPGSSVFHYTIAPVPEASTWAMMILGLGLAGAAIRRRSTNVTVSYA